jgi:hypothetical protein
VQAGNGEANRIFVGAGTNFYTVEEKPPPSGGAALPVGLGAGCTRETPTKVRCGISGPKVMTVNAGDGDDVVYLTGSTICAASAGINPGDGFVSGGPGDDDLNGNIGFDALSGDDGNDKICGGSGRDLLRGGAGNDELNPRDSTEGGDTLEGGPGVDVVTYRGGSKLTASIDNVANDVEGAGEPDNIKTDVENIVSNFFDDTITGSAAPNRIESGGGNDTISGGTPLNATSSGRPSQFTTIKLVSTISDDVLIAGDGDDTVNGDGGADLLDGGLGTDVVNGGAGEDTIQARDAIADTLSCGADTDQIDVDLRDAIPADCENVDSGAVNEGLNVLIEQRSLKVTSNAVLVPARCPRAVRRGCRGTLRLSAPGTASSLAYALKRGKSSTLGLALSAAEAARLRTASKPKGRLTSIETGDHGRKTTVRVVPLKISR